MIHHIPISQIEVGEHRLRRTFEPKALEALVLDIQDKGLLHPIVLRDDGKTLVAGERRLRAMRVIIARGGQIRCASHILPEGCVPCTLTSDLSDYQIREAELTENTIRQDLSWQERVKALEELHELKRVFNPAHTYSDTAEIIDPDARTTGSNQMVREAVILARNLDDPDIAKAKTQKEAIKILSRKLEGQLISDIARQKATKITSHTLVQGDAFEIVPSLPSNQFDCILTDPPYGLSANTKFGSMSQLSHTYEDDWDSALDCYTLLARQGFRVCRPEAHLYTFCDPYRFSALHDLFTEAGWWVFRSPLIWAKGDMSMLPFPDHGPRRTYEAVLYAIKGAKRVRGVYSDLVAIPNLRQKLHAAQKPVELYANLLQRSCSIGDRVLDPFAGSGTILPAANLLKLVATAIEQDPAAYNLCQARILSTEDSL